MKEFELTVWRVSMTEMELVFEYSWRMVLLLYGRSGIEMWMDFRNCKDDGKLR